LRENKECGEGMRERWWEEII